MTYAFFVRFLLCRGVQRFVETSLRRGCALLTRAARHQRGVHRRRGRGRLGDHRALLEFVLVSLDGISLAASSRLGEEDVNRRLPFPSQPLEVLLVLRGIRVVSIVRGPSDAAAGGQRGPTRDPLARHAPDRAADDRARARIDDDARKFSIAPAFIFMIQRRTQLAEHHASLVHDPRVETRREQHHVRRGSVP